MDDEIERLCENTDEGELILAYIDKLEAEIEALRNAARKVIEHGDQLDSRTTTFCEFCEEMEFLLPPIPSTEGL